MIRATCLTLLGFAACTGYPDLERAQLSDLPGLRLTFGASFDGVFVEVGYDAAEFGTCALLDEGTRATIGGVELPVTHRGSRIDPEGVQCRYPELRLSSPPPAE